MIRPVSELCIGPGRTKLVAQASARGDQLRTQFSTQPVDQYFDDPRMPQWEPDSVAPAVANLMQWGGTPYGGNNDHDAQVLYYRKDIIEDPEWQAAFEAEMGYPMPGLRNKLQTLGQWED